MITECTATNRHEPRRCGEAHNSPSVRWS